MSVDTSESVFRFSECFDALFLNELYGGDIVAAAEVFGAAAPRIEEAVSRARAHLRAGEREELRRVVHHIKPLFGYTGLPGVQVSAEVFEASCLAETDAESLEGEFVRLEKAMLEASVRIAEENARMSAHKNRKG